MKKTIAIVAGGDSSESVISLKSAEQISRIIDKERFIPYTVFIKGTTWVVKENPKKEVLINKDDFSFTLKNKKITFDCAFIIIHGSPGEDGKLQAYFELMKIPYTSCGVLCSALTFNKYASKVFVRSLGVKTAKCVLLRRNGKIDTEKFAGEVGIPCFVKPNKAGSSFGVSKVHHKNEMLDAILKALDEDDEVIIEEYIKGSEITCGLFKSSEKDYIFPLTEIKTKREFFDYEAKYTDGMAEEITPADVPKKVEVDCKLLSSFLYDAFDCRGVVRFDYILQDGILYFLEMNSVPGMSKNSIVPRMVEAMGMSLTELITLLIEDASGDITCGCKQKKNTPIK